MQPGTRLVECRFAELDAQMRRRRTMCALGLETRFPS